MSLILVPLALAGAAAAQAVAERRADGRSVRVQTRMRDVTLLAGALRDLGAAVTDGAGTVVASWDGSTATFSRGADGIWAAHVAGVDERAAIDLVTAVDGAYGRRVQHAVLERLRAQAPAAGLRLQSESVTADAGVRLVFEVERA
ncbi:hypothetical protein [Paractinoplanes deccanensis]|uniref:hypothetical protein n=1 Tax=Paractinoplanes deccanensis TaxID=113561 RepID=UPI001EF21FC4|nr:hypothetical protein [Actinoplanes deccanensis]